MIYNVMLCNEDEDTASAGIIFTFENIEDVVKLLDTVAKHTLDTEIYIRMIDD